MKRRSIRSPMVSFVMFLVVACMGFVAWEKRDDLRWDTGTPTAVDPALQDEVMDALLDRFANDGCFVDLRTELALRPREERFHLEILVESGQTCEDASATLCKRMAQLIERMTGYKATVVAYDAGARQVGRCVQ